MLFTQSQPERRVYPQVIGVIAILIACRNLIDSLPQQFEQGMIRMSRRPQVIDLGCRATENVEALIDLPQDKEAGIGGDLCALKINADGPVEIRPYGFLLFVTNRAHADSPPSNAFVT
jgi:hypothetical protein